MEEQVEQVMYGHYPFNVFSEGDHWAIVFPDLPGCQTTARSWEEIGIRAREVLELWAEFQVEEGFEIPEPSRGGKVDWFDTEPLPTIYTVGDIAETLGVSERRVRSLAESRGVGRRVGKAIVFSSADVERMKPGPAGRPKKKLSEDKEG